MRRRLDAGVLLLVVGVMVVAHFLAVGAAPLVRYGFRGAEYLEHIQRQHALDLVAGLSWGERLRRVPDHLALLDGQYPALLHLLATAWGALAGEGFAATAHLNLLFLALLAGSTAWMAASLAGDSGSREEPGPPLSPSALAAAGVLLLPAVFATARRYYYDLPLTAWCALAVAALLASRRRGWTAPIAGAATAAACLTKWQALLYLFPAWIWALAVALRPPAGRTVLRGILPLILAGSSVPLLCWPVIRRSDLVAAWAGRTPFASLATRLELSVQGRHGSLDEALAQGTGTAAGEVGAKLLFYGRGVLESSIGPLLCAALLVCVLAGRRAWRAPLLAGGLVAPPLVLLITRVRVMDERFLLPLLPVLVASSAAAWGACRRSGPALAAALLVLVAGFVQLLAIDGALPRVLAPRASIQMRGWNRPGEVPASPWQSWLEAAEAACPPGRLPSHVRMVGALNAPEADLYAWRWAFIRGCPGIEVGPDPAGAVDPGACPAVVSAAPLSEPGLRFSRQVSIPGGHPPLVRVYRSERAGCP